VICTNIAILVYISSAINQESSEIAMDLLGLAMVSIPRMASLASLIQLSAETNYVNLIPPYAEAFHTSYLNLLEIKPKFVKFDSTWNFCPQLQEMFEKTIPVYQVQNLTVTVTYETAYDFLDQFISAVT
jgi:hypothetical protein